MQATVSNHRSLLHRNKVLAFNFQQSTRRLTALHSSCGCRANSSHTYVLPLIRARLGHISRSCMMTGHVHYRQSMPVALPPTLDPSHRINARAL